MTAPAESRKTAPMKSPIIKRSVLIAGRKTSVSLEDDFWNLLKEIAGSRAPRAGGSSRPRSSYEIASSPAPEFYKLFNENAASSRFQISGNSLMRSDVMHSKTLA